MKISEFISLVQKYQDKWGDLELKKYNYDEESIDVVEEVIISLASENPNKLAEDDYLLLW